MSKFKPPFKVSREKMSSAFVVDAHRRVVARFDAGQAGFEQIADEVARAMNTLHSNPGEIRNNWTVTEEDMSQMRGNSKFWTELFAKMTTSAFIKQAKHYLANCSHHRGESATYDDSVCNTVLPEALKRMAALEAEIKAAKAEGLALARNHFLDNAYDRAIELVNEELAKP